MATAVSFGQITITDITDVGSLSCYPSANQPLSVIYNPDQATYTPNWGSSNLIVTPNIQYAGQQLTSSTSGLTITWTRQEGNAAATALTTGEAKQTNGSLKVTANKFTASSTMLSYILTAQYTEPESGAQLTAEGKITFSLVKQASAARTAQITGDTIFKYNASRTIVGASSITLTAEVNNVSITKWQYQTSSGWADVSNSSGATSITVSASTTAMFINEKCVIKLITSDANVYDIHVITKLYDGTNGTSTVAAVLTNEDQIIPANSSGTPTSYDGCETELMIQEGSTVKTGEWTIAISASNVTFQVSTDGSTWQTAATTAPTGDHWTHVKITAISADVGSVTFTASKTGYTPLVKTFSLTKIKTGANGTNATIYDLEPEALAVNKSISGTFTPSSVVVKSYSKTGSNNRTLYAGRMKFFAGSTSGTAIYTSGSNENSHTLSSSDLTTAASAGYITCVLYAAGGTTTVLDTQTITITSDGATGSQGQQGIPGVDAYNVTLGNYADVLACTSANNLSAATTITIPFTGWQGTSRVACSATAPTLFGVNATVTNANETSNGSIVYNLPANTPVSSASGTVSLSFTIGSATVTAEYRWTRSTAATNGTNGKNAVVLTVLTPNGTVFNNGTGSLELTGALYNGATEQTSSVTWAWAKYTGSAYTSVATTKSITVQGTDIDGYASYRCQATYSSKTYTAYVSVIDKSDPLQAEVFSSIGNQIVNGTGVGAFYVIVTRNGVEVDPIKSTRFLQTAPSGAASGDYYYHLDKTNKTVTLKKYSGSAWANAPAADLPTGTYEWTHMDKDGATISGVATTGKVIYIDGTLFDKKMVSNVQVTI